MAISFRNISAVKIPVKTWSVAERDKRTSKESLLFVF